MPPTEGSREESFLASGLWRLPVVFGVSWLVVIQLQALPLSSHGHLPFVCLHFPVLVRIPVVGLGSALIQ